MTRKVETAADAAIRECLSNRKSFALIAGAGSGKTSSLVDALEYIRNQDGQTLRQNEQRVACITYTKRAVQVINERLGFDSLFVVSTLHSFLWSQIGHFQRDIREALRASRLPALIAKERGKDNGGKSRAATEARTKAARLEEILGAIDTVERFTYDDAVFGDYLDGKLGHDDVIAITGHLLESNATFRRIVALRFPYIFVDEAQDTFKDIVNGLNSIVEDGHSAVVGYFGDPWQQIYDGSVGSFAPPTRGKIVSKTENFRSSESVIRLLNAFREDVQQVAAGKNRGREGSVVFRLVKAETPELPRNRYSELQIERALATMDGAITEWGWNGSDVMKLFLARQMIARRVGFAELNKLFTGPYASARSEELFASGEHFLLAPLTNTIYPLVHAHGQNNDRQKISILRRDSPAFAIDGPNASKPLNSVIAASADLTNQLSRVWRSDTIRDIFLFSLESQIIPGTEKLLEHLGRPPRTEEYNEQTHVLDKGDWLADSFFEMRACEIPSYASFITNNTPFSTQHGVKGEEYSKVLVVYDDFEAGWNNYSFSKLLTPQTAGIPTDGQRMRSRNLAYVSFSRAKEDLRVLFFTADPTASKNELVARNLLRPEQIEVAP